MSVLASIQLGKNATPTAGSAVLTRVALGGNGFSAPSAMYALRNFATNGDASGGEHTLSVIMDPDYCSMVGYATMQVDSNTTRDIHWQLSSPAVPVMALNLKLLPVAIAISGSGLMHTWMPPAMINPGNKNEVPTLVISSLNIEDEVLNLNLVVFIFDIRAREVSTYAQLIGARGGMYMNPQTL